MKITFIGATRTVTGSRFLIDYNHSQYLVDCGMYQGPKELRDLNWEEFPETKSIRAIILTHAHIDHSGALPKIVKDGFKGPIYASPATIDLAKILLLDAAYLQEEDAKYANKTKHSSHHPAEPLYRTEDAEQANALFYKIDFHQWKELEPGLSLRFLRAGHILGSSLVQFRYTLPSGEAQLVTFTGDLGNSRSELICDPETVLETHYLVCESTYGDRCLPMYNPHQFAGIINRVLQRGGTLIVPAFALGRSQELMFRIRQLEQQGLIDEHSVYLDSPMALDCTDVYLKHHDSLKVKHIQKEQLWPKKMEFVRSADESMLLAMSNHPKIILSASGMLQGGRVLHHLKSKLPDEKNGVLFVGYQGAGTKGRLLKNGIPEIRLHHQNIEVNAEIFSLDNFSSHADSNELMAWISAIQLRPQKIFLVHGEEASSRALYYRIKNNLQIDVELPQIRQSVVLE